MERKKNAKKEKKKSGEIGLRSDFFFLLFFFIHRRMGIKNKAYLSSPHFHAFSYARHVCRFNSSAFAIQLVFWRVLRFPR